MECKWDIKGTDIMDSLDDKEPAAQNVRSQSALVRCNIYSQLYDMIDMQCRCREKSRANPVPQL